MSSKPEAVIEFRQVSKYFILQHDRAYTIKERALQVFSNACPQQEVFWALKNVSFNVYEHESIGILGGNGSGKSTILRLIAQTLRPTHGEVTVKGQTAPLIELGVGFHPELTGEENVFLNASLYGLTRSEIRSIYNDIVVFSELGSFMDVPVKYYSSGMYMRLGFSIAIHLNPQILLIDEVLAVGDASFQRKCFDRVHRLREEGKTIVLVSHEVQTVRSICDRVLKLDAGQVVAAGSTDEVLDASARGAESVRVDTAAP